MKKHIALGSALLLTLGTAVAGTLIYGKGEPATLDGAPAADTYESLARAQQELTPETIAMWRATAASTDDLAPRVPI